MTRTAKKRKPYVYRHGRKMLSGMGENWAAWLLVLAIGTILALIVLAALTQGAWGQTFDTTIATGPQTGLSVSLNGDSHVFDFAAENAMALSLTCNNTAQVFHSSVFGHGTTSTLRPMLDLTTSMFSSNGVHSDNNLQELTRVGEDAIRGPITLFVETGNGDNRRVQYRIGTTVNAMSDFVDRGTLIRLDIPTATTIPTNVNSEADVVMSGSLQSSWLTGFYPRALQHTGAFELLQVIHIENQEITVLSDMLKRGDMLIIYGRNLPSTGIDTDLTLIKQVGYVAEATYDFFLYAVDDPTDRIIWSQSTGIVKGMLIRPLYDIDGIVPTRTYQEMQIPTYVFSNVVEDTPVTCRGFVSPFPHDDNIDTYATQTVTFTPDFDCDVPKPILSGSLWVSLLRLSWLDIEPEMYCMKGMMEPTTEIMEMEDAVAPDDERIDVFEQDSRTRTGPQPTYEYRALLEFSLLESTTIYEPHPVFGSELIEYTNGGDPDKRLLVMHTPGILDANGDAMQAPDNVVSVFGGAAGKGIATSCSVRGEVSGTSGTFRLHDANSISRTQPTVTDTHTTAIAVTGTGGSGPALFGTSEGIIVSCTDLQILNPTSCSGYTCQMPPRTTDADNRYTFSQTLAAAAPMYEKLLAHLQDNGFGWGTGQNAEGMTLGIMGMPFVAVLGIITAFAGFQYRHLPASIIVYISILGGMSVMGLIDWGQTVFGALVMIAAVGIFSRGFR